MNDIIKISFVIFSDKERLLKKLYLKIISSNKPDDFFSAISITEKLSKVFGVTIWHTNIFFHKICKHMNDLIFFAYRYQNKLLQLSCLQIDLIIEIFHYFFMLRIYPFPVFSQGNLTWQIGVAIILLIIRPIKKIMIHY